MTQTVVDYCFGAREQSIGNLVAERDAMINKLKGVIFRLRSIVIDQCGEQATADIDEMISQQLPDAVMFSESPDARLKNGPSKNREPSASEDSDGDTSPRPRSLVEMVKHYSGCIILQSQIQEAQDHTTVANSIIDEMHGFIGTACRYQYGRYCVRMAIRYSDEMHQELAISEIINDLVAIACNVYGSWTIQNTIPYLAPRVRDILYSGIVVQSIILCRDARGHFVIQKVLSDRTSNVSTKLDLEMVEHFFEYSNTKFGCAVLCECIEKTTHENVNNMITKIVGRVKEFGKSLCTGFVLKALVSRMFAPDFNHDKNPLWNAIVDFAVEAAFTQFGCSLIQLALEKSAGTLEYVMLVTRIVASKRFSTMASDMYGNYVVQSIIDTCSADDRKKFVAIIMRRRPNITTGFFRFVKDKIDSYDR